VTDSISLTTTDGDIAVIRICRPEVLNALDVESTRDLADAIAAAGDEASIRALVITGGEGVFCAGDDLRDVAVATSAAFAEQIVEFQRVADTIRAIRQPVIAAIGGVAAGGGLEIAIDCDARLATSNASFSAPEVRWGLTMTNGASVLLRRLVGEGWAREMAMFGVELDASAAFRLGLITRIVEIGRLEEEALKMARNVAAFPASGLRQTKAMLNADPGPWASTLALESQAIRAAFEEGSVRGRLEEFLNRKASAKQ
jgi:enoyl-CoA hydratase/carnithine racemase